MIYQIGITPACAGQIVSTYNELTLDRDHPRLRGTNSKKSKNVLLFLGSPPLARDKLCYRLYQHQEIGITPACAGQILSMGIQIAILWDHPRLRGTNVKSIHF